MECFNSKSKDPYRQGNEYSRLKREGVVDDNGKGIFD